MAQESNKHFVQTEKPALLSEDREVRETRRRPFTDRKRDTTQSRLGANGREALGMAERNHLHTSTGLSKFYRFQ